MTTTTPPADYRAGTDPTVKHWHLTSVERGNQCFCGAVLIWSGDTRKVALKVAEASRNYELSEDLTRVTCGACKRSREYAYATGAATRPEPVEPTVTPARRGGRRATGNLPAEPHASGIAAAAADANADANGQPSKRRRKSRADRANEQQQRDAAKAAAAAAVTAIDDALAENAAVTGAPAEGETGDTAE
jgi:hypothetical protein